MITKIADASPPDIGQQSLLVDPGLDDGFLAINPEASVSTMSVDAQIAIHALRGRANNAPEYGLDATITRRRRAIARTLQDDTLRGSTIIPRHIEVGSVAIFGSDGQGAFDLGILPATEARRKKTRAFALKGYLNEDFQRSLVVQLIPDRLTAGRLAFGYLGDREKEWMKPESINPLLLKVNKRIGDGAYVDGVLLNPREYQIVPRNISALGESSEQDAHRIVPLDERAEDDIARARRARLHTYESKVEPIKDLIEDLERRRNDINRLVYLTQHKDSAIESKAEIVRLYGVAWSELLNVLDVLHIERGWDDEQRQMAETSMLFKLAGGNVNENSRNWQSVLMSTLRPYIIARQNLAKDRLGRIQKILSPKV